MNCPSRTDDTLLHCEWNQNPPTLAPDLTTRQDLNGISNVRQREDRSGLAGVSFTCFDEAGGTPAQPIDPEKNRSFRTGASLTQSGRLNSPTGAAGQGNPPNINHSMPQTLQGWALWLLSVLFTAALISHDTILRYVYSLRSPSIDLEPVDLVQNAPRLPKRDSCASNNVKKSEYNTPLHVAALFIILSVSTLACVFPVLASWSPRMRIPASFLFFVSHFGTGVLIATAFVHLLPTAFQSLNDPCLSKFWTSDYPEMPGAIALGGIFLVTVIEMVFSPARHCCRGGTRIGEQPAFVSGAVPEKPQPTPQIDVTDHSAPDGERETPQGQDLAHLRDMGPLVGRSSSMSRAISRMGEDPERICRISSAPEDPQGCEREPQPQQPKIEAVTQDMERNAYDDSTDDGRSLSPQQKHNKAVMQVFLLEMGILFHSVFIGMSLSVSVGNEFVILLIAIVFHQSFEGLALGSRIAALDWPEKALQPWLMSLAYGCTTPIGQAIGLATHTLYSPDSEVGLLLVGTMNAISAGLLIFASLVELMSEDFLSDESWRVLRGKKRVYACFLVFGGAFCMSLVGAWA
ncbi:Zip-domain-containing protein [Aspergillus steynii IBT 23096]|uniref:Zip-domain-containing protein n=1 Tax=Aspergillus steynii IBT 23096 TaxID=1392250 RepID=A0A2I2G127_9EURO|nr:Zip-domain-containing protein [Aspergillus steynii IBT 23096]PLB46568.1 Zip-domain-containing protein [Aspergillus steynii IBT 23096]